MKWRLKSVTELVFWTVVVLGITALLVGGGLLIQKYAYPWYLSIQRRSVENSKSFTDANNNMLESYKLEYARLDTKIVEAQNNQEIVSAYEAQQKAILARMCLEISTMQKNTVNPATLSWLNSKGGCR